MLLVHQTGTVKVGEVIRYTLTYSPSQDRILPTPSHLCVKIKNTSAIPLRAAYLHGPYTLHAACYPSTFNPNRKHEPAGPGDVPQFEPNLKAGGSWMARLYVPETIRESGVKANVRRTLDGKIPSSTWIVEIASQVIFSSSAAVHFEVLIGRDEKSVDLSFFALAGATPPLPGQLQDLQHTHRGKDGHHALLPNGVYSKAIHLVVEDTEQLWNKPILPELREIHHTRSEEAKPQEPGDEDPLKMPTEHTESGEPKGASKESPKPRKRRKIHLVILTHGLHSNIGADMLYLKESIDAAAKQARLDARERNSKTKAASQEPPLPNSDQSDRKNVNSEKSSSDKGTSTAPLAGGQEDLEGYESDEEEVVVRGFSGNVVRTERGLQYLGKRLAKFVLSITYPDQPYLPIKKSVSKTLSRTLTGQELPDTQDGHPAHGHSSIRRELKKPESVTYQITSISFIAHSLGGLTQTYAIAYIHKHSPQFFKKIRPVNFVALGTPFLGLSNENPIYVKFALDFGLVGRTGQDLGLTWRAPTVVRSGWDTLIGGRGVEGQRGAKVEDPGAKPLLRVLPTGPAHQVLKMFKHRTVYSNVVNDGIVPLRTSCLLFLDWGGLERVEKARRENGLVGTMAGWGWAELTGANSTSKRTNSGMVDQGTDSFTDFGDDEASNPSTLHEEEDQVPQPPQNAITDDNAAETEDDPEASQFLNKHASHLQDETPQNEKSKKGALAPSPSPLSGIFSLLSPGGSGKSQPYSHKTHKIYKRGQTLKIEPPEKTKHSSEPDEAPTPKRPEASRGYTADDSNVFTPPKTSFFESAGDILSPPIPMEEFLIDPTRRPRTIFHDRIYHPEDIPLPPPKHQGSGLLRSLSGDSKRGITDHDSRNGQGPDSGGMKVEEKIARAYHRDLSWRKVLVRLEPDAHNNIFVRRMFANAYGWPVVKHLVDTHFSDAATVGASDQSAEAVELANPMDQNVGERGEEVKSQEPKRDVKVDSELPESRDELRDLVSATESNLNSSASRPRVSRDDSGQWDDRYFDGTDDEEDDHVWTINYSHSLSSLSPQDVDGSGLWHMSPSKPATPAPAHTEGQHTEPMLHTNPLSPVLSHISAKSPPVVATSGVGLQKPLEVRFASNGQTVRR